MTAYQERTLFRRWRKGASMFDLSLETGLVLFDIENVMRRQLAKLERTVEHLRESDKIPITRPDLPSSSPLQWRSTLAKAIR